MSRVIVLGAGVAGLAAARELQAAGRPVTVLDKGRGVGGRVATRRDGEAVFDHGCQHFQAAGRPEFRKAVDDWLAKGVIQEWYREGDGEPRFYCPGGMTALAKHLADGLDVHTGVTVAALERVGTGWRVRADGGEWTADALVLTPPVPQTLALLTAGGVELPADIRATLDSVTYEPSLTVLATLAGPSRVRWPGWVRPEEPEPLSWLADNRRKGVSPEWALTLQAGPKYSRDHYDDPDAAVTETLLVAAAPYLGATVVTTQVKRWRYAFAAVTVPVPSLPGLAFAGDAFGGPRLGGAWTSGVQAARSLLA